MELLKKEILKNGEVKNGNILKVDNFLNHRIDVDLMNKIGKEFYKRFKNEKITKILTIEASGIAIAVITAQYFKVPVVFAKKVLSQNLDREVYESKVYSFTKDKSYTVRVSKKYINKDDNILIVDDFLADGNALTGLIDISNQGKANVKAIGIVIEKGYLKGGKKLRDLGFNLQSLVSLSSIESGEIVFE